jgi:hypothetical protein
VNVAEYQRAIPRLERLVAVDVTGVRHYILAANADDLYAALSSSAWPDHVWLETAKGIVRLGSLVEIRRPA